MGGRMQMVNLGLKWYVYLTMDRDCLCLLLYLDTQLTTIHGKLQSESRPFFLVRPAANTVEIGAVEDYDQFFDNVPPESVSLSSSLIEYRGVDSSNG
jgi:hypothetical protein